MKYLIIGTGGTGGCIGGFLASGNNDVSFISRGKNLEYMKQNGLRLNTTIKGEINLPKIKVFSEDEYTDKADVIFVCVKSYSIDDIIPVIKKAAHENTVIIPTLNGYGIGEKLSGQLDNLHVLDGCVYISAFIDAPGSITQLGNFFKIVFGARKGVSIGPDILNRIKNDLNACSITAIVSENIQRDTFKKFTFISAFAACAAYYDITAGFIKQEGGFRQTFVELCKEIEEIGNKLGLELDVDITKENLKIVDSTTPDTTSSMQRDLKEGKNSEIDGLIFEVVRLAGRLGVDAPVYSRIAKHFGFTI